MKKVMPLSLALRGFFILEARLVEKRQRYIYTRSGQPRQQRDHDQQHLGE
jgi:hypothetical protein